MVAQRSADEIIDGEEQDARQRCIRVPVEKPVDGGHDRSSILALRLGEALVPVRTRHNSDSKRQRGQAPRPLSKRYDEAGAGLRIGVVRMHQCDRALDPAKAAERAEAGLRDELGAGSRQREAERADRQTRAQRNEHEAPRAGARSRTPDRERRAERRGVGREREGKRVWKRGRSES
ncbi:hypothetical protein C5C31_01265 [Rathayibacter rathayi]|nr:hypothetical protein C5C02_01100 [Rathayibacter rathayi]PPG78975.1 hypothetical protein C5C23_00720 [Rathayibacter rathayi]PPH26459.1 hypothetical protein C5C31_01265 [Rathayibacter rathayi]PPI71320.1 hypothetical protein C5E12_07830 [Rathayibacter rathayi]PPI76675.1 hypothetical protein C5E03_08195 [Rathayibacter rathayi]